MRTADKRTIVGIQMLRAVAATAAVSVAVHRYVDTPIQRYLKRLIIKH